MSNALEHKGYFGTVEFSAEDNVLFGKVIGINSLISYEGDSLQTLKQDFEEAVEDYLEMCIENGTEPEKSYKGSFNVRIDPVLHRQAASFAALSNISLNQFVESAIADKVGIMH